MINLRKVIPVYILEHDINVFAGFYQDQFL